MNKEGEYGEKYTYLEMFLDENEKHKKFNTEYINTFETISWGLDHCLLVDKKFRAFSCGFGKYGRLGHGDEKDLQKPTLIKDLKDSKIIDVQCGMYHSLAVAQNGDLYSWGPG